MYGVYQKNNLKKYSHTYLLYRIPDKCPMLLFYVVNIHKKHNKKREKEVYMMREKTGED